MLYPAVPCSGKWICLNMTRSDSAEKVRRARGIYPAMHQRLSLVAQRHHGIDLGRPPCRDVIRQQSYPDKGHGHPYKRDRV
jgi:hypothetical protein